MLWIVGGLALAAGQVMIGSVIGKTIRLGRKGLNHG